MIIYNVILTNKKGDLKVVPFREMSCVEAYLRARDFNVDEINEMIRNPLTLTVAVQMQYPEQVMYINYICKNPRRKWQLARVERKPVIDYV